MGITTKKKKQPDVTEAKYNTAELTISADSYVCGPRSTKYAGCFLVRVESKFNNLARALKVGVGATASCILGIISSLSGFNVSLVCG